MAQWPDRGEVPWDDKLKAYIDEAAATGAPNTFPRTPPGRWLMAMFNGMVTNQAPNSGFVPIQMLRDQSWDAVGLNINTAASDATVHIALYADDGTGYPGELMMDFGTVDASTTGGKTIDLVEPIALPAGLYWTWAYVSNSSVRLPVTSHTTASLPGTLWHSGPAGSNTTTYQGGYISAAETPPAVAPGGMSTNRWLPIISMRAA